MKVGNMKISLRTFFLSAVMVVAGALCAQERESKTEGCDPQILLGKKWSMTKVVNGDTLYYSYVFDRDSVTNVVRMGGKTMVLRYAYYFSDSFPFVFEDTEVGRLSKGKWFNSIRWYMEDGRKRRDGGSFRIFSLTENEFSFGRSPQYPMIMTPEQ